MNMTEIARIRDRKTGRVSSWDVTGRNNDRWFIPPGESRVLADIKGPGIITHLWLTQEKHYRECLIKITWDNAITPSVLCPLGDFFGLGNNVVNSYQSLLFSASTNSNNQYGTGVALNCYVPMPFHKRAVIELINESDQSHMQYFYVDYETASASDLKGLGYFHAEFRRTNPFGGWGPEITVNTPCADAANKERVAWKNNYVILETRGKGHYIGCNISVSNFQKTWWGEGDDMIWVDGYKWPPDLHGTGSEDYLNQAWGMQPNAFLRNGSSVFEGNMDTNRPLWQGGASGHQTSYVHHIENPVRFKKEIKVTIEHGHANHLANEMSSVAYWYADKPTKIVAPPPVKQRMPVMKVNGEWVMDPANQCPGKPVELTDEMRRLKREWQEQLDIMANGKLSEWHSPFYTAWKCSKLLAPADVRHVKAVKLSDKLDWKTLRTNPKGMVGERYCVSVHGRFGMADGLVYLGNRFHVPASGLWTIHLGHDGGARLFIDGKSVLYEPTRVNPIPHTRSQATLELSKGTHEMVVALDTDDGMGWGIYFSFEVPKSGRKKGAVRFPVVR